MGAKVVPATTPNQWQGFKFSTFQELDYATSKKARPPPKKELFSGESSRHVPANGNPYGGHGGASQSCVLEP